MTVVRILYLEIAQQPFDGQAPLACLKDVGLAYMAGCLALREFSPECRLRRYLKALDAAHAAQHHEKQEEVKNLASAGDGVKFAYGRGFHKRVSRQRNMYMSMYRYVYTYRCMCTYTST